MMQRVAHAGPVLNALTGAFTQQNRNMATLKAISMRLKSVKNIQKITQSMKMVSAAKWVFNVIWDLLSSENKLSNSWYTNRSPTKGTLGLSVIWGRQDHLVKDQRDSTNKPMFNHQRTNRRKFSSLWPPTEVSGGVGRCIDWPDPSHSQLL